MTHKKYSKIVLVVLDGFGVATYSHGNAIALANPENINYLLSHYPSTTLQASGPLVGLPWGEMGNSEVGHLNIGAGRIVGQDLPRITMSIQKGDFFRNEIFLKALNHVKENHSSLHLMGMISSGGVHSLDEHLYALLGMAQQEGVRQVFIHMFTDGRDTDEKVALDSLVKIRAKIKEIGVGEIATVTGRFYAMDRGKHWDQTEIAYQAIVNGIGQTAQSAEDAVQQNYTQNIFDEMIPPTVIVNKLASGESHPVATVHDNDSVIFFNFRSDRALQLTQAFVQPESVPISSKHSKLNNLCFVTMTEYEFEMPDVLIAFPRQDLNNNLAQIVSHNGWKQFHAAESEKYAHVTSFFNGGMSDELAGEERIIVTSPSNSKNYEDHPEMSAEGLTDILVDKITKSTASFFVVNYANPDMVGHTGNLQAAIAAVQCLDGQLKKVMQAVLSVDAALLITADHGNVEQMINPRTGGIDKDHTTSPVPCLLVANEFEYKTPQSRTYLTLASGVPEGAINDIAPTILDLFGLPKPPEMTGVSLLEVLLMKSE